MAGANKLPLNGIRILELTHAVMGPTTGLVLADMGAEVIKVEPAPHGDPTRRLKGFGSGFMTCFNRNKKSLSLDLKSDEGKKLLDRLIETADVLIENFGPGTIERLGFPYERVKHINPRLIFCSLKGFMPGPYENKTALDETIQMMSGLAYMTGPRGRPLRAGASVVDIMGGSYGVIGILTALYERERTGEGQLVLATLFESAVFLVGQHMAYAAISGQSVPPMPDRRSAWGVYQLFKTKDGEFVFLGITSDQQWQRFCEVFGLHDLLKDERFRTNNDRVAEHADLIPKIEECISHLTRVEFLELADKASVPYATVNTPEDLFEDPHLNASGGLLETALPNGQKSKLPGLPLRIGTYEFGIRHDPPHLGQGSREVLESIGLGNREIEQLVENGVLGPVR